MDSNVIAETSGFRDDISDVERERAEYELLFDIARTFDKHVELRTALGPLLSLLEIRAGLGRGMVTLLDRSTGLL
jgi:Nif-specific regulatory protein